MEEKKSKESREDSDKLHGSTSDLLKFHAPGHRSRFGG